MARVPDLNYVSEKMLEAVSCMCSKAPLEQRIGYATTSALDRLGEEDLPPGKLRDSLKYVLRWTKENTTEDASGRPIAVKVPSDPELSQLTESMCKILLDTHELRRTSRLRAYIEQAIVELGRGDTQFAVNTLRSALATPRE